MKRKLCLAAILIITALTGCTSMPDKGMARAGYASDGSRAIAEPGVNPDLNDTHSVKTALYAQYDEWKGTRYQLRGLSKDGIDCSGFVHLTFKSKLGRVLPRSSDMQVELGFDIDKDELRAGDLVFFKTGKTLKHVGVYLEDGRFIHVSTKLGVVISHLNESYWKSAYWKAKRLET